MIDKIILYSQPGCGICATLKRELKNQNIPFIENQDIEEMKNKGIKKTPVLEVIELYSPKEAINFIKNYNKGENNAN